MMIKCLIILACLYFYYMKKLSLFNFRVSLNTNAMDCGRENFWPLMFGLRSTISPWLSILSHSFSFFLLQQKSNWQHSVLAGTAVRSTGTARGTPLLFGKSGTRVVHFFLVGYQTKLTTSQGVNYTRDLMSNMVLWISPIPLSR